MRPGLGYGVHIEASCGSSAEVSAGAVGGLGYSSVGPVSGECQAVVDPWLAFDQPAFDELMGANTFALVDYYVIQTSPNLVPEPQTQWMLLAGLSLLTGLAMRRQSRPGLSS